MTTLPEIQATIRKRPLREHAAVMATLHPPVDDERDPQLEADAAAGRLDPSWKRPRSPSPPADAVPRMICSPSSATERPGVDAAGGER